MSLRTGGIISIPSPIDVHVHLREPGGEHKETIASGTYAAMAGGYQAVFDMPNNPGAPTHTVMRLNDKGKIALESSRTDIGFYAGVDLGNPNLSEMNKTFKSDLASGVKFYMGHTTGNITEYGFDHARIVADEWMKIGREVGRKLPILLHAREEAGEETADYIASEGNPVHWCHISTVTEAEACKRLTNKYPDLFTAGVTPHHFTMTSRDADFKYGWNGRMMPPLGIDTDHEKLVNYFNKRYIQILETDHAPHTEEEKLEAEAENPTGNSHPDCTTCFGVSGIEFVLPIMFALVKRGVTTLERLEDALHHQPIRMLGLYPETMGKSKTLVEVGPRVLTENDKAGKSSNHPYVGWMGWGTVLGFKVDNRLVNIEDKPKKDVKILTGSR